MKWVEDGEPFFVLCILVLDTIFLSMYIDDLYGWSQMRKHSKRMVRRWHRRFIKASQRYLTAKEASSAPLRR